MRQFFLTIAFLSATLIVSAQRIKYNFNAAWKVFVGDDSTANKKDFDDRRWREVTVPYAWNEDDAFKKDIVDLSTGIAWYRKHFRVPVSLKGQKFFIEFEGIRQAGEFYINGNYIGLHENGVTSFGFDITPFIDFDGENVIAARINNDWDYKEKATGTKYQWEDRNFNANYGGIIKNVYLHSTPKIYQTLPLYTNLLTTGTYVYATGIDITGRKATINAESEVRNETSTAQSVALQVVLKDAKGNIAGRFTGKPVNIAANGTQKISAAAVVGSLNFWSWGYGYLYTAETSLLTNGKTTDHVVTKTGFRKTAFKEGMFYLNDRVLQLKGYAQRTSNEWPALGNAVPAWLSDYSNKKMVESNGNLVRWMHITPCKQDVESCDRVGLLQAMPAGDAEKDVDGVRWTQRTSVMRDAIIYNKNNPSIIFYESGNESISEKHMQEMKAIRDKYDPYGGRAIGSREMLDSKVAEYGGEMLYINKSARHPLWAMEYSRDEGLRKYWDDYSPPFHKDGDGPLHKGQSAATYNRNQESHAIENVIRWYEYYKVRPGTGRRVSSGGVNIVFSETNTHHRGAENYRRSGEVDALRITKENFFSHQVMWDGWVDVEKPRIHIIGHWNYSDTVVKDIFVVSSAEKVELKVNGKSLGFGQRQHGFLFTFKKIQWKPGNIEAIGYDKNDNIICQAKKITTGTPVAIRLKVISQPGGMKADGHDIAIIEAEAIDRNGNRNPIAMNMIKFSIYGQGEWRGGMAQGPGNYILSKNLPLECGVNRVLVRSTTMPGTIAIKATAEGLAPANVSIVVQPYKTVDGLGNQLPGQNLPLNFERGATPSTPSFIPSRESLTIIKATAGSNTDSAFASYDDNELSDWVNDGKLETAWIEYELEKASVVDQIELKLNNFRSREYYLRITVDGEEVFKGLTEKTLGYTTLVCKPRTGKRVRIQLLQPATTTAITAIEVNGKKLDDGVARNDANAKGTLSIIEAEIYKAINLK